jgi:hypothetical protein
MTTNSLSGLSYILTDQLAAADAGILGGILQEVSNTPSAEDDGRHAEVVSDICTAVTSRTVEATLPRKAVREPHADSQSLNNARIGSFTPVKQLSGNSSSLATGSPDTQLGKLFDLFELRISQRL